MPIRRYLENQAFDPETVGTMSVALESSCEALGLAARDGAARELVAKMIINFAQRGVRDPTTLRDMVLETLHRDEQRPAG